MNPKPKTTTPLSKTQVDTFEREGWVVIEDLFEDRDLQPVIDEVQGEVDRRAAELIAAGKLSRAYREAGFERQLARISAETTELAHGIWNGSLAGPAFFDLIRSPKLLDVAESICGPELIASSVYRLRPKIPNVAYGAVPWHQDSGYMEPYCDRATILTFWIPLVDATRENGCMWVLPGCHRNPILRHSTTSTYLEIRDADLPPVAPVCVPMRKGSALMMHNLTPHGSFANTTDGVRYSFDLRYQAAALPTNARIDRLPGESMPSAAAGIPAACYPPEADFLVRSRARPNQVVSDPAVFHRLRADHLYAPVTPRW